MVMKMSMKLHLILNTRFYELESVSSLQEIFLNTQTVACPSHTQFWIEVIYQTINLMNVSYCHHNHKRKTSGRFVLQNESKITRQQCRISLEHSIISLFCVCWFDGFNVTEYIKGLFKVMRLTTLNLQVLECKVFHMPSSLWHAACGCFSKTSVTHFLYFCIIFACSCANVVH